MPRCGLICAGIVNIMSMRDEEINVHILILTR
jgi:hypothetical protein